MTNFYKVKSLRILLCFSVISACSDVDLVNDYRTFNSDQGIAIVDSNSKFIVDPNVIKFNVYDSYIIGLRVGPESDTEEFSSNIGYFVLDSNDANLTEGLTEEEFFQLCAKNSINATPVHPHVFRIVFLVGGRLF